MQDPLTGKYTVLSGARLPEPGEWSALLGCHRERLRALDQLVEAAGQCDIRADQDRDFVLLPEDEVSLLEAGGPPWSELGLAIRAFRRTLPLIDLELFGFSTGAEDSLDTNTPHLVRIGGGVEALAFESKDHSIYKFYFFREGGEIGATFRFSRGEEVALYAHAAPGQYRALLLKLMLIHRIGMPTEIIGITSEGILVVKQALGEALPQGTDTSGMLPAMLIPVPSRYLRADRDHPRLHFFDEEPWLIADLHARNHVRCVDGSLRLIDIVAGPWPVAMTARDPLITRWIDSVRCDPGAGSLPGAADDEL